MVKLIQLYKECCLVPGASCWFVSDYLPTMHFNQKSTEFMKKLSNICQTTFNL